MNPEMMQCTCIHYRNMSSFKYVVATCTVPIGYGRPDYVYSEIFKVLMYILLEIYFLHYYNKQCQDFIKVCTHMKFVNTDFR